MGAGFRVASIGPAGERGVKFATISNDGRHAGRGGLGAVMGSKRLKAVAVRGDANVEFAHPRELTAFARELSRKSFGPATAKYRELGTSATCRRSIVWERCQLVTFSRRHSMVAIVWLPRRSRLATLVPERAVPHARSAASTYSRNRTVMQSASNTRVSLHWDRFAESTDPSIVLKAARMCDDLGIDTISAGASIAFAMECAERGLIDTPDLAFGNGEGMLHLLRDIGERRGLGETLSLGMRAAAEEIGQESEAVRAACQRAGDSGLRPACPADHGAGFRSRYDEVPITIDRVPMKSISPTRSIGWRWLPGLRDWPSKPRIRQC